MDSALGDRFAGGHPRAFDDVYAQLGPVVLAFLRRRVGEDAAEDVLQRTFAEVWRSRDRYDPTRPLEAWVLHIAGQRAIDHLRHRSRARPLLTLDAAAEFAGDDGRVVAERYVRADEVRTALASLPDGQRDVLVLCYFADCTRREAAERLGVPVGTAKARAFRGLHRLAELLADDVG